MDSREYLSVEGTISNTKENRGDVDPESLIGISKQGDNKSNNLT